MRLHLLLLLLLIPSVYGLGISPARIILEPEDTAFTFRPVTDVPVTVRVEGDLAQYIVLEKSTVEPGEDIRGSISLPADVTPGSHQQYIVIATAQSAAEGFGASAEVAGSLLIQIPYPDEYLHASWDIARDGGTGAAQITVTIQNLGSRSTTPAVTVFVGEERILIPATSIAPGEFNKLTTSFSPHIPGEYDAILEVRYADRIITSTKTASFGLPVIAITDLTYHDEAGEIKPIDISGTLVWNRPLNATLQILIDNSTTPILTETVTISESFTHRAYLTTDRPETIKVVIAVDRIMTTKEISTVPLEKESVIPVIMLVALLLVILLLALKYWQKPRNPGTENIIKTETEK